MLIDLLQKKRNLLKGMLLLLTLIGTLACTDQVQMNETNSEVKVIGGDREYGYPSAVKFLGRGGSLCTGTLIAPRLVLTAAHCIQYQGFYDPNEVVIEQNGSEIFRTSISDYIMHPLWNENVNAGNDLALLYLSRSASISPSSLLSTSPSELIGQEGLIIGYGRRDANNPQSSGLKFSRVLRVSDYQNTYFNLQSFGSFGSACSGDSGGPLFIRNELAGVASYVTLQNGRPCVDRSYYTSIYPHYNWILENAEQATYGIKRVGELVIDRRGRLNIGVNSPVASCTAEGRTGQCIPSALCEGDLYSSLCPGSSDIQCCISSNTQATQPNTADQEQTSTPERPFVWASCEVNGVQGECIDRSECSTQTVANHCPGNSEIQCCLDLNASPEADSECATLYQCLMACRNSTSCRNDCTSRVSRRSIELYNAVALCYQERCNTLSCLSQECAEEYQACGL